MYLLYSLLLGIWLVFMLPIFLINVLRKHKPLDGLVERTGNLPQSLKSDGRITIWFHSCSVGETLSIQPLASVVHERFPEARLVFSTITGGGRRIAEDRFDKYGPGNAFYFPIDEPLFVNRVLDTIRPNMLIVVDTEIWPNTLRMCRRRGIPIALVNGRISGKSFEWYRWFAPMLAKVFENYDILLMKADEDAVRIRKLGAPAAKVRVSGNIKYDRDTVEKEVTEAKRAALSDAFGLHAGSGRLIVVGSTHEPEEEILFTVLQRLRQQPQMADVRMMIAPRHAERFNAVASTARKMGFTVCRRSENKANPQAEILMIDTHGELAAAYQFADIAFVGGTLIPHGGQSIMEPALYGKAIVIGQSMENFPNIIDDFLAAKALWRIEANHEDRDAQIDQVHEAFVALFDDPDRRQEMGDQALSLFEKSRGATAYTATAILQLLDGIRGLQRPNDPAAAPPDQPALTGDVR